MLKTPRFPVWVVKSGERFGVMFCLNKDLVNDWSVTLTIDFIFYKTFTPFKFTSWAISFRR